MACCSEHSPKDWAERHGHEFSEDAPLSCRQSRRSGKADTQLSEFCTNVEKGTIPAGSFVVVESLDRLSRNGVVTFLRLANCVAKHGVNIVVLSPQEQVLTKESSAFEWGILLGMARSAEIESERRSERMKAAWRVKRQSSQNK